MLLLIDPARDGGHNTYICRGSDRQIEPLGPDVESPLHSCWDKITVKNRRGGSLTREGGFRNPWNPPLAFPLGIGRIAFFQLQKKILCIPLFLDHHKNNQNCPKRIHPQYTYTLYATLKLVYFRKFSSSQMILNYTLQAPKKTKTKVKTSVNVVTCYSRKLSSNGCLHSHLIT